MIYRTKPSVKEGTWYTVAGSLTHNDEAIDIKRQYISPNDQDHFAIYINGKRQRKTYFGETAHFDVARAYNDLVPWQYYVDGMSL